MKAAFLAVLVAAASVPAQTAAPAQAAGSAKALRIELSIPAPVKDVWQAFTTTQGLSS
jgi:hypothetical protein